MYKKGLELSEIMLHGASYYASGIVSLTNTCKKLGRDLGIFPIDGCFHFYVLRIPLNNHFWL